MFSPASLLAAQRASVEVSHSQDVLNQGTIVSFPASEVAVTVEKTGKK